MTRLALALILLAMPAAAQQHHHPLHKDFYQHWKIPGTDRSCCNARVEYKTDNTIHEVGDCEPTHAIIRNGKWLVWIRQIKEYLPVPEDRILRERNPNVENAHVCWTPASGIICFVPEDTGG